MKNTSSTNTKYEIIYYTDMYLDSEEIKGAKGELVTKISIPIYSESGITGHVYRAAVKTVDGVEVDNLEPIGINKRKNDAGVTFTIIEESTARLERAKDYQKNHPDEKVIHEQRVQISEEGFYAVKANHDILRQYFTTPAMDTADIKPVPLELIGGKELGVFQDNCGHWVNSENKRALLEGSYLYNYTEKDISNAPGWIHKGIGFFKNKQQFVSGDKERTELSNLSLEEFAKANNLPVDRIRKKELVKLPEIGGLMLQTEEKNAYVIAPNPALVASAASEEAQIDEHFAQLAVTEDERESKVKSIIAAVLKAFKEKFEAILDKFKNKFKDDVEQSNKEIIGLQQDGKADVAAITQQTNQEIKDIVQQLQSSLDMQVSSLSADVKAACDEFGQQKVSENEVELAMAKKLCLNDNSTNVSTFGGSTIIDLSHIGQKKNAEIEAFNAQKLSEYNQEKQALEAQLMNQKNSLVTAKKSEASGKLIELKSSIQQRLESKSSDTKAMMETAKGKAKDQKEKCDRKIQDIQEDASLIERLKEVVGNSGDAEAVINEELNVFLQGAASDFGVDAVNL
jgi:hypothetical protein